MSVSAVEAVVADWANAEPATKTTGAATAPTFKILRMIFPFTAIVPTWDLIACPDDQRAIARMT
jgi:hypothetical protein